MGWIPSKIKLLSSDGEDLNPATEDKQDDIISAINNSGGGINYAFVDKDDGATYVYFGFKQWDGENWKIMRKTVATGKFQYAYGTSGYNTNWTNRASLSYSNPPD